MIYNYSFNFKALEIKKTLKGLKFNILKQESP
jgi:hypothetical protein